MFKFTIRDLLWLTVVVALGVAWWIDRGSLISQYENQAGNSLGWKDKAQFLEDALRREGWKISSDGNRVWAVPPPPNSSAAARNLPKD